MINCRSKEKCHGRLIQTKAFFKEFSKKTLQLHQNPHRSNPFKQKTWILHCTFQMTQNRTSFSFHTPYIKRTDRNQRHTQPKSSHIHSPKATAHSSKAATYIVQKQPYTQTWARNKAKPPLQ